jgi:hypothetical protein
MNKFDSFSNDELVILANSLVGEAGMYRDMFSDGISHASGVLDTITSLSEDLLVEIGNRKAVALAEIDQINAELNNDD